jgi:hypothetical protein
MSAIKSFVGVAPGPVPAGKTLVYTGQFVDETNTPITAAQLASLTLSIIDPATGAVVNGVSGANILNSGRGVVDTNGNLTLTLLSGDTVLLNPTDVQETRSIVLDWTYSGGQKSGAHRVDFQVQALGAPPGS